jgi:hypothetical protein
LCLALLTTAGCAAAGGPVTEVVGTRGDARSITPADLASATQMSLLDFVAAERPNWLRGPDGRPLPVIIYVNDGKIGGAQSLRDITLSQVATARFYDVAGAQARYGARVNGPVIAVITK